MTLEERYAAVLSYFEKELPDPFGELRHRNSFELLVAVILSAQCTDVRVNQVTPALFAAYPDAQRMAQATEDDVYPYIASCSYPHSKSKHLVQMARMLVEEHGGQVPQGMDELQRLPGVGRKTANVVRSIAFGIPGLGVDTHVQRVSYRIGLVDDNSTPLKVEMALTARIAPEYWTRMHLWLVLHGRYICKARAPLCAECGLRPACLQRLAD